MTAPAAIAAVSSTPWFKTQTFEADAAGPAMAGLHQNFCFIGKVPTRQSIFSYSCG
jgi:hypothetical protein